MMNKNLDHGAEKTKDSDEALRKREDVFDSQIKAFRLSVKRRLLNENGDLKGLPKSEMKKELDLLYKELEKRYVYLLSRARKF